jgi:hypothetical protein
MLPDLRIVIAAVVSTFILTVGVGFFASSRLIHEQMTARVDTKGLDDTPINRIALNWPEPTKAERNIDLDFAISIRGSGNPVRDITSEIGQTPLTPIPVPSAIAAVPPSTTTDATPPEPPSTATTDSAPPAAATIDATPSALPAETVSEAEPAATVVKAPEPTEIETPAAEISPAPTASATPDALSEKPASPELESAAHPETTAASEPATLPETVVPPETAAPAEATTDTRVVVYPDRPETAEATGSVPTSTDAPAVPLPESRPKLAARPEPREAAPAKAAKPTNAESRPTSRRKRARRPVVKPPAAQPQQFPFDFFGLFRPPGIFRLQPQTQTQPPRPANPVS